VCVLFTSRSSRRQKLVIKFKLVLLEVRSLFSGRASESLVRAFIEAMSRFLIHA
jgi:hypothetical protein